MVIQLEMDMEEAEWSKRRILLVHHGESLRNVDALNYGRDIRELIKGNQTDDWKVYINGSLYKRTLQTWRGIGIACERERPAITQFPKLLSLGSSVSWCKGPYRNLRTSTIWKYIDADFEGVIHSRWIDQREIRESRYWLTMHHTEDEFKAFGSSDDESSSGGQTKRKNPVDSNNASIPTPDLGVVHFSPSNGWEVGDTELGVLVQPVDACSGTSIWRNGESFKVLNILVCSGYLVAKDFVVSQKEEEE
uniref:Uncharacterized protein n=1 Tax=Physcomitrium patens TaxID=3218 RepID=A0A7I4DVU3_PHYPA